MEYQPPRTSECFPGPASDKMSMIAMAQPVPHAAFKREFSWDEARQPDYYTVRPRSDERIHLPSIRQAFPELHLRIVPPEPSSIKPPSLATSPIGFSAGAVTPPEYVYSPNSNKRRRLSIGEEREDRASWIPRLYTTSPRERISGSKLMSPISGQPSATESWTGSSRASSYTVQTGGSLPSIRSPVKIDPPEQYRQPRQAPPAASAPPVPPPSQSQEQPQQQHQNPTYPPRTEAPRPTLPSLPQLNFDRGSMPLPRIHGHASDDYPIDGPKYTPQHLPITHHSGSAAGMAIGGGSSPIFHQGENGAQGNHFGYHHPSRVQSLSMGSLHHHHHHHTSTFDRSPFSAGGYGQPYHDYIRHGDLGGMGGGVNGDTKQRKRRGNLPKETTDKLRAWFHNHLAHPYPTEDEKQELMRQTGLQMNQISNWFINARRRQLPGLRSNMDVISARAIDVVGGDKILPTTERIPEYDLSSDDKGASMPLSDGEGSAYDDELENLKRRRVVDLKRGSV